MVVVTVVVPVAKASMRKKKSSMEGRTGGIDVEEAWSSFTLAEG